MYYFVALIVIVLLIRLALMDLSTSKAQKLYLILASVPIILLMGFRYEFVHGSGDIWSYYEFYQSASKASLAELFEKSIYEPGFVVFNKIFATIVPYPQFIFFLEGVICVAAVCRFIYKYSESPFLGILFFITLGTMLFELTAVRQGIAMSICLFAVEYVEKRKLLPFALLVLVAATFHKTAIAFFPFYFIAKVKPSPVNLIMMALAVVMALLTGPIIIGYANKLFNMGYTGYIGNDFGGWAPIFIFLITLFLMLLSIQKNRQYFIFSMLLTGLAIYLLRYTTLAAERISFYFTPALIVALPRALERIPERSTRYVLYTLSSLLAISIYLYRFLRATLTWQVGA